MSKRTARIKKPPYTVVCADEQGGEVRFDFELGCLVALQDGRCVGYPEHETAGLKLLSERRLAVVGVA